MTKSDLVKAVVKSTAREYPLTAEQVEYALEHILGNIKVAVHEGKSVTIRGFGAFRNIRRKQKLARNISKGAPILIPERNVVNFKPYDDFMAAPIDQPK